MPDTPDNQRQIQARADQLNAQREAREQRREEEKKARQRAEKEDGSLGDGMAAPSSTPAMAGGVPFIYPDQGPPSDEDMSAPGPAGGATAGVPQLAQHHRMIDLQKQQAEVLDKVAEARQTALDKMREQQDKMREDQQSTR